MLEEAIEQVRCRWCDAADTVELRPARCRRAGPSLVSEPDAVDRGPLPATCARAGAWPSPSETLAPCAADQVPSRLKRGGAVRPGQARAGWARAHLAVGPGHRPGLPRPGRGPCPGRAYRTSSEALEPRPRAGGGRPGARWLRLRLADRCARLAGARTPRRGRPGAAAVAVPGLSRRSSGCAASSQRLAPSPAPRSRRLATQADGLKAALTAVQREVRELKGAARAAERRAEEATTAAEAAVGEARRQVATAEAEARRLKARLAELEEGAGSARRATREGRSAEEVRLPACSWTRSSTVPRGCVASSPSHHSAMPPGRRTWSARTSRRSGARRGGRPGPRIGGGRAGSPGPAARRSRRSTS